VTSVRLDLYAATSCAPANGLVAVDRILDELVRDATAALREPVAAMTA